MSQNPNLVEFDFFTPSIEKVLHEADSGNLAAASERLQKLLDEEEVKVTLALPISKYKLERIAAYPGLLSMVNTYKKRIIGIKKRGYDRYPSSPWLCNSLYDLACEYLYNFDLPQVSNASDVTACTFGSCFALNIKQALEAKGIKTATVHNVEDFNNPLINEILLSMKYCKNQDSNDWMVVPSSKYARIIDEHDKKLSAGGNADLKFARRFGKLQEDIKASNLVIFSVGTAFVLKENADNEIIFESLANPFAQRNELLSVDDLLQALTNLCQIIRELNQDASIVLTLSPIPIWAVSGTNGKMTAIEADCISKSSCRLAINRLIESKPKGVFYFPSYEIVRWLAPSIKDLQVWTDPRHLNRNEVINTITDLFCDSMLSK